MKTAAFLLAALPAMCCLAETASIKLVANGARNFRVVVADDAIPAAKFGAQPCAVDFSLDFPSERSAQDAANVAATLKQAGWRVDQGELEKAVGFTLEREESTPQMPAFARAKARTPLQNGENRLQNAPRVSDGQGDPKAEDALVEALSGLFEKTLAEAAAEAVEKEEKQDEE